jgi:hypothetical protein
LQEGVISDSVTVIQEECESAVFSFPLKTSLFQELYKAGNAPLHAENGREAFASQVSQRYSGKESFNFLAIYCNYWNGFR